MADGKVIVDVDVKDKSARQKIKEFGATFKDIDPSISGSTKKIGGFASSIKNIAIGSALGGGLTKALSMVSSGIGGLMKDLGASSATWKTFEGNLKNTGKSAGEIKKVKGELQDYATQTIYSASDMASTYAQLNAVGTKNTTELVKGFGGLASASESPTQAMKTLSQQATQMAAKPKVAWEDFKLILEQSPAGIAAVAKTMGMSTQELIKGVQDGKVKTEDLFGAIEKTGNSKAFSKMATEFKTPQQAMDGLKETLTTKLQPSFDKVSGIAIKGISSVADWISKLDIEGFASKVGGVFEKVLKVIKNVIDFVQSNKDWLVPLVVGITAFVGVVKTIAIANKAFGALKRAMDVAKVIKATAGSTDLLKFALQNMSKESKIARGAMKLLNFVANANPWVLLVGAIVAVVAGLVWFFTQTEVGRKAWQGFVDWLSALWQGIVTFAQGLWTNLATFFTNLWNSIATVASDVWNGLVAFFTGLWNGIVTVATSIWTIFGGSITGIWNGIVEIARGVWELLKNVIMAPILILIDLLTGNWTKIQSDLSAIWQNIVNAGAQIWDGFKTYIKGILDFFATYFSTIWKGISNVVISIINGIVKGAQGIWNGFVSFVKGFLSDLKGFFSSAWNSIKNSVISIANGIVSGAQKAWNSLKKAVSDTVSAVGNIFNKLKHINLFNIGKHIVQGLIDGIGSMVKAVGTAIGKVADKVTSGIRGALGIHSPSKVTYALGEYVGEGLRNGIKSMIGSVGNMSVKLANAAATKPAEIPVAFDYIQGLTAESALGLKGRIGSPQTIINNINNSRQVNKMAEAVSGQGMSVYLDSREVGKGVIQPVSKELGNEWKMNNRKLNR